MADINSLYSDVLVASACVYDTYLKGGRNAKATSLIESVQLLTEGTSNLPSKHASQHQSVT